MNRENKERTLTWVTFFTSTTTLFCCTLPILLVTLGFGSLLVSLSSRFHWWITLAEYKFWLFLISGFLLITTYWTIKKSSIYCPSDPALAEKCQRIRRWNFRILRISLVIWVIGFISAYLALPISTWFGM